MNSKERFPHDLVCWSNAFRDSYESFSLPPVAHVFLDGKFFKTFVFVLGTPINITYLLEHLIRREHPDCCVKVFPLCCSRRKFSRPNPNLPTNSLFFQDDEAYELLNSFIVSREDCPL